MSLVWEAIQKAAEDNRRNLISFCIEYGWNSHRKAYGLKKAIETGIAEVEKKVKPITIEMESDREYELRQRG